MCATYVEDIYEYLRNVEVWIRYDISSVAFKHHIKQANTCIVIHFFIQTTVHALCSHHTILFHRMDLIEKEKWGICWLTVLWILVPVEEQAFGKFHEDCTEWYHPKHAGNSRWLACTRYSHSVFNFILTNPCEYYVRVDEWCLYP